MLFGIGMRVPSMMELLSWFIFLAYNVITINEEARSNYEILTVGNIST